MKTVSMIPLSALTFSIVPMHGLIRLYTCIVRFTNFLNQARTEPKTSQQLQLAEPAD